MTKSMFSNKHLLLNTDLMDDREEKEKRFPVQKWNSEGIIEDGANIVFLVISH